VPTRLLRQFGMGVQGARHCCNQRDNPMVLWAVLVEVWHRKRGPLDPNGLGDNTVIEPPPRFTGDRIQPGPRSATVAVDGYLPLIRLVGLNRS
jgi:hypothetical protein